MERGSEWRRWEPHVHAPGTVLNDQFGPNAWDEYLKRLEEASPAIEALGVTDYYLLDSYEAVLSYRSQGRLQGIGFVFPNIEVRLDVAAKTGFVNAHLLVNPTSANHLEEIKRFMGRLDFAAYGDRFHCNRDDLIRLGRCADASIVDDIAALRHGATQFKVSFDRLKQAYKDSDWAKENVLIAVAGASGDGTSGLNQASDTTIRREIEKFAHLIFSSSPAQREFWLGQKVLGRDGIIATYGACKPCLHGSDAHALNVVGQPTGNRYSWIKGNPEFDALRQACINPEGRAYVGEQPPSSAMPSHVICHLSIQGTGCFQTPEIPLNNGLVAIVGARGSGKTALADIIAAGCDAIPVAGWDANENASASFLVRARSLLGEAKVTLTWGGGAKETRGLSHHDSESEVTFAKARYLSQQFVEELCSASGASDGLVREIERVVFQSHEPSQTDFANDFNELRDQRTLHLKQARQREELAIAQLSDTIGAELEKEASISTLSTSVQQKRKVIADYTVDRGKLTLKGTQEQVERHRDISAVAQTLRAKIQNFSNQRRAFLALQGEVDATRRSGAPEMLRQLRARHLASGMDDAQWDAFLLIHKGSVEKDLQGYVTWADTEIAKLKGAPPPPMDPAVAYIGADADLSTLPLAVIEAEMARLAAFFSSDQLTQKQFTTLTERINKEQAALTALEQRLTDAKEAPNRRRSLQADREAAYERAFQAIIDEQSALEQLYAPLLAKLASSSGTLGKLGFSVRRIADVDTWALEAEEALLDRRKSGPFYGVSTFTKVARSAFLDVWEKGTAADIRAAMTAFMASHLKDLLSHAPIGQDQQEEFRAWSKRFARWLFSTDHLRIRYEITYDGVDIRKLSPGTRGIVLLLLYLALDEADDRPLIIDQPEENLDPKSVFDELVSLFVLAKSNRQVIMVTHNANLVINTDADQVIIANSNHDGSGGLPKISYQSGGLESASIRKAVCDILEGGESAFKERARRLRVRLER
ncbi:TrlF family AAA-like ATPase [Xanthomonas citri]|uniref:TrlF family AAA-like ATPase n=1 Tax=Xanthomonas citri TaxID=346 RepID=UPI001CBAF4FD|nr:AAA family ATPase [Xanthomonas citri]